MTTNIAQGKALRWAMQGLTILLLLAVAVAAMLYFNKAKPHLPQARANDQARGVFPCQS